MTTSLAAMRPAAIQEVQEAVLATPRLHVVGGHSKPALSTPADQSVAALEMTGLSGILEYDPGEYTFTALAGTSLATVEAALAEHGQYMPFDPPLVEAGATLGGTVAAGLSGSGRQRYGGVRDFLIGVRLVDGQGRLVRGGGKVVKNAAGFDLRTRSKPPAANAFRYVREAGSPGTPEPSGGGQADGSPIPSGGLHRCTGRDGPRAQPPASAPRTASERDASETHGAGLSTAVRLAA